MARGTHWLTLLLAAGAAAGVGYLWWRELEKKKAAEQLERDLPELKVSAERITPRVLPTPAPAKVGADLVPSGHGRRPTPQILPSITVWT